MDSRSAGPIRVLIADGHPVYREGLAETIRQASRLQLVGHAETGSEALAQIRRLEPDVAVLDVELDRLDGIQVALALSRDGRAIPVLFLSACLEGDTVYRAVEAGARGYISKQSRAGAICDAIAAVADGRLVLAPEVQETIATQIRLQTSADGPPLTERELEVLSLIADGLSVAEIAGRLYLSPFTVKTYIKRTYRKLGVSRRGAAVAEAIRRGLLQAILLWDCWEELGVMTLTGGPIG
jgi:two-component system, NarL family, nitrate/nitrite response regulator NarL